MSRSGQADLGWTPNAAAWGRDLYRPLPLDKRASSFKTPGALLT